MFDALLFLYFFTLHADQLSFSLAGVTLRVNNLIGLALLALFLCRLKVIRIDRALLRSLLILTLSILLSFLLSPYKKRCLIFLCWYAFTIGVYFLLPYLLIRNYDYKRILSLYFLSFLCVGVYAFLQLLLSVVGISDPFASQWIAGKIVRSNAFAYEPSYYALYMTPFIVMANYFFLAEPQRSFAILGKLTYPKILLLNLLFFLSTSTSTLFAFFLLCFGLLFFAQTRRHLLKYLLSIAALFTLFGLLSPYVMKSFFLKFFHMNFMSHHSFFERWCGIQNSWRTFLEHPFFGTGLGGVPLHLYKAYLSGETRVIMWQPELWLTDTTNPIKMFEPSNVLTEALASLGLIGALALSGIPLVFLVRAKRAMRIDPISSSSLILSVIVMLIVLQFNQGLFRTYVWVHLALAFALVEKIVLDTTPLNLQISARQEQEVPIKS